MKTARFLSILGHPFVTVAVMVSVSTMQLSKPQEALRALVVVGLIAIVPVAALMAWQVRRGAWQNVDASNRRERPVLFGVSLAVLAVLVAFLMVRRPDSFYAHSAAGTLAMLVVCAIATRWVKVSLHLAFAALAGTSLALLGSPVGWLLLGGVPALAWSRLKLERHRPIELVLGLVIGVAAGFGIHAV
jgi:membrane-associated phospholipid phosphatase